VRLAKKLLAELPDSNWLKRNPLIKDHEYNDSGLYDLLLHSQDRAYDVPQFVAFAKSVGLDVVEFVQPVKYDPTNWVKNPELLSHVPTDRWARYALAEELCGTMHKHIAYLTRAGRAPTIASLTPESVPYYHYFDGARIGEKMPTGGNLIGQLAGMNINMVMPRRAGLIMQRVNGQRSWRAIHAELGTAMGRDAPEWDTFWREAQELYQKLQGINVMLLRTA
jgi:hypothetical protein